MTEIRLHNSLTRRKEAFAPINPADVRMYVCGPTVYDRAHIGNARPVVVFDVLYRLLRHVYGADHVTYVRNVCYVGRLEIHILGQNIFILSFESEIHARIFFIK